MKVEFDEKMKEKTILENNVETLKNTLRIARSQGKYFGTHNTRLLNENDRLISTGSVRYYIVNIFKLREPKEIYILCN